MVDVPVLISRVRGVMVNPKETFFEHMQPAPPWTVVAREHVLPLLVASGLLASLLILAFSPVHEAEGAMAPDLMQVAIWFLSRLVFSLLALVAMTVVVGVLAVVFDGQPRFNSAFTLVALAMTPSYLGEGVFPLPVIGPILGLAGLVYSLMILYQGIPLALKVPDNKRVFHFILSLVVMFVLTVIFLTTFMPLISIFMGLPAS